MTRKTVLLAALGVAALLVASGAALVALSDDGGGPEQAQDVDAPGSLDAVWSYRAETGVSDNHHEIAVATVDGDPVVAVPVNGLDDTDQCRVEALDADGEGRWRTDVPPEHCSVHAVGDVSVGDVDGDGVAEFAVGTGEDVALVLDAASGEEQARGSLDSFGFSAPLILDERANVSAGGQEEQNESADIALVVADFTGGVHGFDANGSKQFSHALEGSVWASPAPVTSDGRATAAVAHGRIGRYGEVVVFDEEGAVVQRIELADVPLTWTASTDGPTVAATRSGTVVGLDLESGERAWSVNVAEGVAVGAGTADQAYAATPDGHVRAFDRVNGDVVWTEDVGGGHGDGHDHEHEDQTAGGDAAPAPVAADVTGDGDTEVVATTGDGTVAVFDAESGDLLARQSLEGSVLVRPATADVTGDGASEVLVLLGDGRVVALSYAE